MQNEVAPVTPGTPTGNPPDPPGMPDDLIIRRSPVGIAVIDGEGIYRNVNPAYCALYGFRPEELLGHSFLRVFAPAEQPRMMALHRQFLAVGGELKGEWEVVDRAGALLNVLSESVSIRGDDGLACRLVYVLDITQRKRTEQALQSSRRFLQSVLDGLSAHVCVLDAAGVIVAVNRAWREFAAANAAIAERVHEGADYLGVCARAVQPGHPGAPEAQAFLALLHDVLAGRRTQFQLEYACHSPTEQRWFVARVSRIEGNDPVRFVVAHDNVTELKQAQEALRLQAATDDLTGAASRRSLMERLKHEYERVRRHPDHHCSVLALDLDHFKRVNDTWGHAAGDAVLVHLTRLMRDSTRQIDVVGRSGGEEFTLLLPDTAPEQALELAERLRDRVEHTPLQHAGQSIEITVSIGISAIAGTDPGIDAVLARADQALYQAKHAGRNAVLLGGLPT